MLEMFNFLCSACDVTECCFGAFPWSFLLLFCMLNLLLGQLPSIRCNGLFLGHRLFVHEKHAMVAEMCMLVNLCDVLVKIENFCRYLDVCTLYAFHFRLTSVRTNVSGAALHCLQFHDIFTNIMVLSNNPFFFFFG